MSGVQGEPLESVRRSIERYYTVRILEHGPTALGVDWSSVAAQHLRFAQLVKLIDFSRPLSLNDVGCGYGALIAFLVRRHRGASIDYRGCDLSAGMIDAARRRWRRRAGARFVVGAETGEIADYAVASGIFNVNLEHGLAEWERFVAATLASMGRSARIGFAVNFMAPPDAVPVAKPLYRVPAERWIGFCRALGFEAQIVEGYGLREYTLLLRRAASAIDGGR